MRRHRRRLLLLAALTTFVVLLPVNAHAAEGPRITLDRPEAAPGDRMLVSMAGYSRSRSVTIAVCGNLARRGSADCAMASSQGKEIDARNDVTLAELVVQAPPMPCPCLVRVTSTNGDEFAVAPLIVTGHPVAEVVGAPDGPLLEVGVQAARKPGGLVDAVRTSLGGRTTYRVTVIVRNTSTTTLSSVRLYGAAGDRWSDELAKVQLADPGPIEPGQISKQTIDVDLPAPRLGAIHWTVTASDAGPAVQASSDASAQPVLLYVFVAIFLVDLVVLVVRWRRSRRRARQGPPPASARRVDDEVGSAPPERTPQLEGAGV